MTSEKEIYRTTDMSLAAALLLYIPLEALDRTDRRRAYFIFPRSRELDALIEAYWQGQLKVEPRAHFEAIKTLKTRLYEPD